MRQYHKDKLYSDAIELNWDIFNICNYHCSYCYMQDKPQDWMKIAKWDKQLKIIDTISKSKKPLVISLVGGEPTLFHKFNEFIDLLYNALELNKQKNELVIISNNTYPNKLLKIDKNKAKNIKLNLSYHSEEVDDDIFFNNLNNLIDHQFKDITVVMLMNHNNRYWNKMINAAEKLSKLPIRFETAYLTRSKSIFKYQKKFDEVVEKISKFTFNDKNYIFEMENDIECYSEVELIKPIQEGKTNFFGWNCKIDRININIDCECSFSCIGTSVNLENILTDGITPIICPFTKCNYNCHLSFVKEKY